MSVISPDHYKGKIEAIEAILEAVKDLPGDEAFIAGNVLKYVWRYNKKGGLTDLLKADNYLQRLIKRHEEKDRDNGSDKKPVKRPSRSRKD